MAQLTDEQLMAYADGELDPPARAGVEAALAQDPEARRRLQIFMATGAPLSDLFSKPMREPVPAHLLARIAFKEPSRARPLRSALLDRNVLRILFAGPRWASAVAWSVPVLLLAAGVVWHSLGTEDHLQQLVTLEQGQIFAQGPLNAALETAPSGSDVSLGSGATAFTMQAVLTFKNRRQDFCRQYDVKTPDSAYAGIACRGNDGRWRLDLHIAVAPHSTDRNRIVPAGKGYSAVEAAVSKVIEGDALDEKDEKALIRNGWR